MKCKNKINECEQKEEGNEHRRDTRVDKKIKDKIKMSKQQLECGLLVGRGFCHKIIKHRNIRPLT